MIEEIYQIVVSQEDEDFGFTTGGHIYDVEFKEYPTQLEIFKAMEELNGDVVSVRKWYRKTTNH